MLLLRAVAAEVTPTRNTEAITVATDALVDHFGPDSAVDLTIITEELADATQKAAHTDGFSREGPSPSAELAHQN